MVAGVSASEKVRLLSGPPGDPISRLARYIPPSRNDRSSYRLRAYQLVLQGLIEEQKMSGEEL